MGIRFFYMLGILTLMTLIFLSVLDLFLLYRVKAGIEASRQMADRFSNGDENDVEIKLKNSYPFEVELKIIDEIPSIFQRRDIEWELSVPKGDFKKLQYSLRPVKRGEYHFGSINVFVSSPLSLVERRYRFESDKMVKVYPSYVQLRKFGFAAIHNRLRDFGFKKQRRIGHTMEFEQIKEYVPGDDSRTINWKATARSNRLMVNQYADQKSQQIFNVIDKGRLMRMPFEGLSLLDYAINAALVLSYVSINKDDKAGLLTFGNKISSYLEPSKRQAQMHLILDSLYNQRTKYLDSDFERLAIFTSRQIYQRSLLIIYSNFESQSGLDRQMTYLKKMATKHILVVIFFKNTGLRSLLDEPPEDLRGIYHQAIAEKLNHEKEMMVLKLKQHGIYSILTEPHDLTVNTINKYLELKSRGII